MAPLKCVEYIQQVFKNTNIKVTVMSDLNLLEKEFPLLHAVARGSIPVPRHHPAVVRLEYKSPDQTSVKEK